MHTLLFQRLDRASSVQYIIPHPCHPCGHFPLSQWLRESIIRGPVMENSDRFLCFVCVSLASPQAWGIKGGDVGCQRDQQGQRTLLRKKSVASSVASVYRRHVENRHMVANVFTAYIYIQAHAWAHILHICNNSRQLETFRFLQSASDTVQQFFTLTQMSSQINSTSEAQNHRFYLQLYSRYNTQHPLSLFSQFE